MSSNTNNTIEQRVQQALIEVEETREAILRILNEIETVNNNNNGGNDPANSNNNEELITELKSLLEELLQISKEVENISNLIQSLIIALDNTISDGNGNSDEQEQDNNSADDDDETNNTNSNTEETLINLDAVCPIRIGELSLIMNNDEDPPNGAGELIQGFDSSVRYHVLTGLCDTMRLSLSLESINCCNCELRLIRRLALIPTEQDNFNQIIFNEPTLRTQELNEYAQVLPNLNLGDLCTLDEPTEHGFYRFNFEFDYSFPNLVIEEVANNYQGNIMLVLFHTIEYTTCYRNEELTTGPTLAFEVFANRNLLCQ